MISGVIITYNEQDKIQECIQSLAKVCEEILVIDAESTDLTTEFAQEQGADVITKAWKGYGQARNFGAQEAKYDWILSIDADERINDNLAEAIKQLELDSNCNYAFHLVSKYENKWIRFGSLHPKWKSRLYHREKMKWSEPLVHETLITRSGQAIRTRRVEGHLLHEAYADRKELRMKLNQYARLAAQQWLLQGYKPSWVKRHFGSYYHFLRSFLLKFGFLDGRLGWVIARELGRYHDQKIIFQRHHQEVN